MASTRGGKDEGRGDFSITPRYAISFLLLLHRIAGQAIITSEEVCNPPWHANPTEAYEWSSNHKSQSHSIQGGGGRRGSESQVAAIESNEIRVELGGRQGRGEREGSSRSMEWGCSPDWWWPCGRIEAEVAESSAGANPRHGSRPPLRISSSE
jgi:hypothetical protein